MTDLDIQELANLTTGDADADNFERLFTKLKEMKGNWRKLFEKQLVLGTLLLFTGMLYVLWLSPWRLDISLTVNNWVSLKYLHF